MIDTFNIEAFELIKLIYQKQNIVSNKDLELAGSIKERSSLDLSDKIFGARIERTIDDIGKTIEIFMNDDNGIFGFQKNDFLRFETLVRNIHSLEQMNSLVTYTFIESESFKWIISVYKQQKAESSLYDYLLKSIDSKVKPFWFYFPVLNLEIETPFKIGNVEFTYFSKQYFDNLYISLKEKKETLKQEDYDLVLRKDFQGQVLAKVKVIAERHKAEEMAKSEAEISVDVLKLYSDTAVRPDKKAMFDLNYRLGYLVQSNFLTQTSNESETLNLNVQFNNTSYNFMKRHYLAASKGVLTTYSYYITKKGDNELYEIIIQSIHLFGSAISNWDLHIRCVNLITILESILLIDEEKNNMEKKAKVRLSKALASQPIDREHIELLFAKIYQIRHKMIHKAKRITINIKELSEAQGTMVNLFLRLIQFNTKEGYLDKATLIEELNKS